MSAQGPTWAYDWTFGSNKSVMDACVKSGMDYMPLVVRKRHSPLLCAPAAGASACADTRPDSADLCCRGTMTMFLALAQTT